MMRVNKLFEKLPHDSSVLLSTPEDMYYYSGFTGEGYVLIENDKKTIYTDGRYTEKACMETENYVVSDVRNLKRDLSSIKNPIYFQAEHLTFSKYNNLKEVADLKPAKIDFKLLRAVKSEAEIEKLKTAAKIAEDAFSDTLNFIAAGKTEREIAAYLNFKMLEKGATKPSFDIISVSGKNTSLPHGVPTDKKLNEGEFLTLDFGCVYEGYCSDMTRTLAIGYLSHEMEMVYDTVLSAQDKTEKSIKPGMTGQDADAIARKIIVDAGYGEYFVHSTGHGVGIEIHEYPTLAPNKECVLEKGEVVTVEPGIYIPGKFGVRIENTLVLTEDGSYPLQTLDKELIIL